MAEPLLGPVNALMKLYADNLCQEQDPWHRIAGRVGWMLRAATCRCPTCPRPRHRNRPNPSAGAAARALAYQ